MNFRKNIVVIIFIIVLAVIGLVLNSVSSSIPNSAQEQMFQQAKKCFQEAKYSEAIIKYRELLNQGANSPHIHNNLASSYQQIGDIGRSVLHYEKALQLGHYDDEIKDNLSKIRQDSGIYQNRDLDIWQKIVCMLSSNHWVILASLSFFVLTVFFVLRLVNFIKLSIKQQATLVLGMSGFIVLSIFAIRSQNHSMKGKAIVLEKDVSLKVSPFLEAEKTVTLQPGEIITIFSDKDHEGYMLVKLESGQTGWLKKGEAEFIGIK